jgi:transaldolase
LDAAIDKQLTDSALKGKAAVANARMAYQLYLEKFKNYPHNYQRPLWASTGVKDPTYRSTMYVDTLIAPNTVNTMPPATLDAVINAVIEAEDTITPNLKSASEELLALAKAGIDLAKVTDHLEADGVEKFMDSWEALLAEVEKAKQ